MKDCIFCKITRGEIPSKKVYDDGKLMAFRDIKPSAPVHIILIPKRHTIANVGEAKKKDVKLMGDMMLAAAEIAKAEGISDNFRVRTNTGELAGQSIRHIHYHIQGGWTKDNNVIDKP